MKIEYMDADGRLLKLEVSDEVGQFYLSSVEETKKSDRRDTRPDRHTSMETFVYEDQRFLHPRQTPCGKQWRTVRWTACSPASLLSSVVHINSESVG